MNRPVQQTLPSSGVETSRSVKTARACQRLLGRELRLMYDAVASEPVPEDFLELLRSIDANQGSNKGVKPKLNRTVGQPPQA